MFNGLPFWYLRIWQLICDVQTSEQKERSKVMLAGYLNALKDLDIITRMEFLNIYNIAAFEVWNNSVT